jgi:predicted nucleic acid-binding protein
MVPSQLTREARQALNTALKDDHVRIVSGTVIVEFGSALLKLVRRNRLGPQQAHVIYDAVEALSLHIVDDPRIYRRGYELAEELEQADTFDATGYALTEALDGEFWTADRRFANAANAVGLPGIRLVS